jgi:uncharacterized membrane protein YdjX (TVP38/TMEM64 family)
MRLDASSWMRWGGVLLVLLLLAAAWKWTGLRTWIDPHRIAQELEPFRTSWLALPLIVLVFVVAELVLFPVLVLVFVCGIAFGPWLGTAYALLGSLASAIVPFLIGRRVGREKLERWGGKWVRSIERKLERRGIVAIFFVRKIPAPYTLVNLICGASPVSLRDFLFGTFLGMGTGIILITVLGSRLIEILRSPDPRELAIALGLLFLPVTVAIVLQRALNRRMETSQ